MVSKVGEGTYGIVLKCRARDSGELVAIKKFKSPITGGTGDSEQVGSAAVAGGWGEGTGWQAGRCACLPVPLYGARHATHLPTAGGRCYCCTTHLPAPPAQVRKTALREVRILRSLRHDNVVSLLDVFRQASRLYLVFEFCERTGACVPRCACA